MHLPLAESLLPLREYLAAPTIPAAVEQIEASNQKLYHKKVESLIADRVKFSASFIIICGNEVQSWEDEEVYKVVNDCGRNDEQRPRCLSVGPPHIRQLIHKSPEHESHRYDKQSHKGGPEFLARIDGFSILLVGHHHPIMQHNVGDSKNRQHQEKSYHLQLGLLL